MTEANRKHPTGDPGDLILIGIGANLPHPIHGPPRRTVEAALRALERAGVRVIAASSWYATAPVPASDQPDYINGVAAVSTSLRPEELLQLLHTIEAKFGRVRGEPNAARTLDLDLLAYGRERRGGPTGPIVPHPRLHERAFVLMPLHDLAPAWQHPVFGRSVIELLAALPSGQACRRLD